MNYAKIKPLRIVVELDDVTWDNIHEKILTVYDVEKHLKHCGVYQLYVGLSPENFYNLCQSNGYNSAVMFCGWTVIGDNPYKTICGYPLKIRE